MAADEPERMPENDKGAEYPDLFARMGAWVFDSLMLMVVFVPVLIFLVVYWYATYGSPVCCGHSSEELAVMWLVPICAGAGYVFHRVYRLVVTGQSPGMRRSGIEIVRFDNGQRISYPKALVRTILPPSAAALGLAIATVAGIEDPLWGLLLGLIFPIPALWNPDNRGWHDQIAGAVVVAKQSQ
ncbi:RDD family protein [Candidatus Poriferisodalis sp.]|uniref:RDD family protein n=1 Tax=Candidatus Poriferisodalis sp. TaxID=3101277 RepID=UPI003B01B514